MDTLKKIGLMGLLAALPFAGWGNVSPTVPQRPLNQGVVAGASSPTGSTSSSQQPPASKAQPTPPGQPVAGAQPVNVSRTAPSPQPVKQKPDVAHPNDQVGARTTSGVTRSGNPQSPEVESLRAQIDDLKNQLAINQKKRDELVVTLEETKKKKAAAADAGGGMNGLVCLLVALGLIPGVVACVLVSRTGRNVRRTMSARLDEMEQALQAAQQNQNQALTKELKTLAQDASVKALTSAMPKTSLLDKKFVDLAAKIDGVVRNVGGQIAPLQAALGGVAASLKSSNDQMAEATFKLKTATSQLSDQLAAKIRELEQQLALCEKREAAVALREQRIEEHVKAEVVAAVKASDDRCAALGQALASTAEAQVQKRLAEMEAAVTARKEAELDAKLRQRLAACDQDREQVQQRLAEKDRALKAEADAHAATRSQCAQLRTDLTQRDTLLQGAQAKIEGLEAAQAALSKRLYPAELLAAPEFAPFKDQLDGWCAKGLAGAEVVRAALGMFAARKSVPEDSWTLALRDIAVGVSHALREEGAAPAAIAAELTKWAQFMSSFSDASGSDPYYFQLNVPKVDSPVDASWMKQVAGMKVKAVNSWAVFTAMGLRYMADIS